MDEEATARPRFKSHVEPIIDSDDGLFLFAEGQQAWLPDPIYAALAPMLDGAHEVEAIFDALVRDLSARAGLRSAGPPEDERVPC